MATKIFLTGVTGYVGGSVFAALAEKHPEYEMTVLLRSVPDGFVNAYPKARIVRGDFDSAEVLAAAAAESDIVIHCGSSDHVGAVSALLRGVSSRPTSRGPGYYIHLSGTGLISDVKEGKHFGKENPRIWSDLANIDAITSLPAGHIHRETDEIVQVASSATVRTAIVAPSDIYGTGTGPGKRQSLLVPLYLGEIFGTPVARRRAFVVGEGKNVRSWCHIHDVVSVYLLLVEDAVAERGGAKARASWGKNGYYFSATNEIVQRELAERVGAALLKRGVIESAEPISLSVDDVRTMLGGANGGALALYVFASSSRSRADRAVKELGWNSLDTTLWDELEADIDAALAENERSVEKLAEAVEKAEG